MLERNADIIQVAPYDTVDGTGTSVGTGGTTDNENCMICHHTRIRQRGTIYAVSMYLANLTNLTDLYVRTWRRYLLSYLRTSQTENLIPTAVAGQVNYWPLATPIENITEGELCSYVVKASVAGTGIFRSHATDAGMAFRRVKNPSSTGIGVAWDTFASVDDNFVPIGIWMQAPHAIFIGDSWMEGGTLHRSGCNSGVLATGTHEVHRPDQSIPWYVNLLLNQVGDECVYQNNAIGGETSTTVTARVAADVVAMKPRYVFEIMPGINDIIGGAPNATTIIANLTTRLNAYIAADIIPVIAGIPPNVTMDDDQHVIRNSANDLAESLISGSYPTARFVNLDPWLGAYRATGPDGNLNDLAVQYRQVGDDTHGNSLANWQVARAFYPTISSKSALNIGPSFLSLG